MAGASAIVAGDTIRDVTAAAGVDPAEWPPVGPVRLIANFAALRDKLAAAAQAAPAIPLDEARLETPGPWPKQGDRLTHQLPRPRGRDVIDHARRLQGYFLKANSSCRAQRPDRIARYSRPRSSS